MERFNTLLNELNIDPTLSQQIDTLNVQVFYDLKNKKNGKQILSHLLYNYIYDYGRQYDNIYHIINCGANVNYINNGNPLLFTIFNSSTSIDIDYAIKIIDILVYNNVNINIQNNRGQTILMLYISITDSIKYHMNEQTILMINNDIHNHTFIEFLISKNINVNIRDNYGNNAIDYINDSITHYTMIKQKNSLITNQNNELNYMNNLVDLLLSRCNAILTDIKPYSMPTIYETKSNI